MLSEITPEALHAAQLAGQSFTLLDVREPEEYAYCQLPGSVLLPLGELPARAAEVPTDQPVVLICHHGVRSAYALNYLRQRLGHTNVLNLRGGVAAWAEQVDPTFPTY